MYAIIETGGRQYRVSQGDIVEIDKVAGGAGEKLEFTKVLAIHNGGSLRVGAPALEGARVVGEVVGQARTSKVIVFKMKRRKNYKRTRGHRQSCTRLKITEILTGTEGSHHGT